VCTQALQKTKLQNDENNRSGRTIKTLQNVKKPTDKAKERARQRKNAPTRAAGKKLLNYYLVML